MSIGWLGAVLHRKEKEASKALRKTASNRQTPGKLSHKALPICVSPDLQHSRGSPLSRVCSRNCQWCETALGVFAGGLLSAQGCTELLRVSGLQHKRQSGGKRTHFAGTDPTLCFAIDFPGGSG